MACEKKNAFLFVRADDFSAQAAKQAVAGRFCRALLAVHKNMPPHEKGPLTLMNGVIVRRASGTREQELRNQKIVLIGERRAGDG